MKTDYIINDGTDENPDFQKITLPETFANRRKIHAGRSSSIKKLGRIARVRKQGYQKQPATQEDLVRYK